MLIHILVSLSRIPFQFRATFILVAACPARNSVYAHIMDPQMELTVSFRPQNRCQLLQLMEKTLPVDREPGSHVVLCSVAAMTLLGVHHVPRAQNFNVEKSACQLAKLFLRKRLDPKSFFTNRQH